MPERTFDLAPDTPLFEEPFVLKIPGEDRKIHVFNLKHRAGLKQIDPSDKQVTWFVEELTHNVVDEEQRSFRETIVGALESGALPEEQDDGSNTLAEMLKWVRDTRQAAEEGTLARSVGRPSSSARKRSSS
jgi:hypothetical protein